MRNGRRFRAVWGVAIILASGATDWAEAFQLESRWSRTATDGSGLSQGDPTTVTWGLVDDGVEIDGSEPTSDSDLIAFLNQNIGSSDVWMPLFEQSFNRWGELSGLSFVHEANNSSADIDNTSSPIGQLGSVPDARIGGHSIDGQSGSNTLAYNYFPNNGDMVIDTDNVLFYSNSSNNYRRLRNTLMHEIGHGIGIGHMESSDAGFLMEPNISSSFDGPQLDDIIAAQRHYGDVWEKGAGNNTFGNAVDLGPLTNGELTSIGTDADNTVVAGDDIDFVSIDDNSDIDYFSFTIDSPSMIGLTLTPKGPTYSEGKEDQSQSPFDSSALSDLMVRMYDTDGTTILAASNQTGIGGTELLDIQLPVAGTYFVQVTGEQNNVQLYQLDVLPEFNFLAGDVNLDGQLTTGSGDPADDDVAAFIAGWKTVLPGDDPAAAWMKGDLNLDRISDLADAYLLHDALKGLGLSSSLFDAVGVPEPTSSVLVISVIAGGVLLQRRTCVL